MRSNEKVLRGRYRLERRIPGAGGTHEIWVGADEYEAPVLIRLWPFEGEQPDDGDRALWDFELRNLFRLASLPEAEDSLIILRDAGVDRGTRHFVMVFKASDVMVPLESLLVERRKHSWLHAISDRHLRAELWRGLRKLASGLVQLHEQQILHRAIAASNVYVEPTAGAESLRLGGFEWSIRVGSASNPTMAYPRTLTPPEYASGDFPYSFNTDWFLVGALFARVIAAADPPAQVDPSQQYASVVEKIKGISKLAGTERALLLDLLSSDPEARLSQSDLVLRRIDDLLAQLERPLQLTDESHLGLVVLLGPSRRLTQAIQEEDPEIRALETDRQRRFIESDLESAEIVRYGSSATSKYMLRGQLLCYEIREHVTGAEDPDGRWNMAFVVGPTELRYSSSADDHIKLEKVRVKAFEVREVKKSRWTPASGMLPWGTILPKQPKSPPTERSIQRLDEFFRITNQVELLMRDAEIFAYEIVERKEVNDLKEEIIIEEISRERLPSEYARLRGTLVDYVGAQIEGKRTGHLFYIGREDSLYLGRIPRKFFWSAQVLDNDRIKLTRSASKDADPVPERGFIRSFDQFGQIALVDRRLKAIQRLRKHGYLLLSLSAPEHVYIDTEVSDFPTAIDPQLDEAKVGAMHSIWRTRPIFTLQGPPGTGKTTLVSHLLRQVVEDDPVAQILITAQAHAAVDVLREKVSKAVFSGKDGPNRPIQIRLSTPSSEGDNEPDPDHVEQVTDRILAVAEGELAKAPSLSSLQISWRDAVKKIRSSLRLSSKEGDAPDMCELVKRSANVTFCTTTAGDLAQLATSTQRFDWSIIEEAGKAHGFDLVLPLQTGHRWLLIGDHAQLPPYRFADFLNALSNLDVVFADLKSLPRRGGLVDVELINAWQSLDEGERKNRQEFYRQWLATFERLHQICGQVLPDDANVADDAQSPKLTAMLSHQHRMHPTIAELISRAYYRGRIVSETVDAEGRPKPRVVHPFTRPANLVGRQIVWIDMPWERKARQEGDLEGQEVSEREVEATARFLYSLGSNPAPEHKELLDLAILSPYRKQILKLSTELQGFLEAPPPWLNRRSGGGPTVFTVDSFQGNQADIVIVSLVRNNGAAQGKGLGFLDESPRMNVLFSRAERLLVLIGSWEFFRFQVSEVAADAEHYLGHWRIALDYIEECFESGVAVRVPLSKLGVNTK